MRFNRLTTTLEKSVRNNIVCTVVLQQISDNRKNWMTIFKFFLGAKKRKMKNSTQHIGSQSRFSGKESQYNCTGCVILSRNTFQIRALSNDKKKLISQTWTNASSSLLILSVFKEKEKKQKQVRWSGGHSKPPEIMS